MDGRLTRLTNRRPEFDSRVSCVVRFSVGKKSTVVKVGRRLWFNLTINKHVVCKVTVKLVYFRADIVFL